MVSTIQNTDVKQKDADHAVVVAITSHAAFESGADDGDAVYREGVAFPLLQALQKVNERLLEENPAESLLFDVILITTDSQQQQQSSRVISSTRHYGLEVSRFCFSSEEDFIESLQKNNVKLFLTTDTNEVLSLCCWTSRQLFVQSEQLRVMFCGDAVIRPDTGPMPLTRQAAQSFSTQLGEMRQKFGMFDSPLSFILVTSHGGRESCRGALQVLRSRGVSVDEAYCLAGAPRGPMLSLVQPHFLLRDGYSGLEE
ncbi:Cytosolic 5'-nucleotidase 1A [Larimichthys crocea]|uniref:Uncharacterized protein n=1 Tax=Larimichthys crocea TaxID=215358 RepID=A0ACD3QES4_LARCR|nr:Cytosolic 5'-nucleotidase 1A [Larimichthys crocea]